MKPESGSENADFFPVLPLLLVVSLLVIVVLSVLLYRCKCKLCCTQEYLARYISEYLELKKLVPSSDRPCHFNPPEISREEFTKIIDNMLRRIMFLPLLMLFALPLKAQQRADSVYEFRFVAENDMFFVPYGNNRAELERLLALVRQYHEAITTGRMPVFVDGYCNSRPDEAENLATARLRSNRVKSELIMHENLKEDCFVTRNHPAKGDWVTVRLQITTLADAQPKPSVTLSPEPSVTVSSDLQSDVSATLSPEPSVTVSSDLQSDVSAYKDFQSAPSSVSSDLQPELSSSSSEPSVTVSSDLQSDVPEHQDFQSAPSLSLRLNLLRWSTLTPDLGLEWRINRNIGILVNGTWTSWSWSDKDRRYALWKLSPEMRYYIGKEKRGFVGAMYHIGEFNYKLSHTGKQGDYQGGGITGGYTLDLNPSFSLDFHAGVGYTRADYDKYKVTDGVRMRCGSAKKDYWGINQVGITLMWKMKN